MKEMMSLRLASTTVVTTLTICTLYFFLQKMRVFVENEGNDEPTIGEYYSGKSVFITGGTGFIGKLLIEKLLYSCPDLKQIYVFVRDKKGITPEKRVAALYKSTCFDRLRNERNGLFQSKVTVVPGNVIENRLGLSEYNRALVIQNTNIIIHSAATVRFDESLKESLNINVLGALRVIELAQEVHNLESYVHVSTAYCNLAYEEKIQEKIYPPVADWREIRDIVDNTDSEALRILTPKLLGKYPNSYVFTKNLAEHVVYEYRGKLPIVIVRPSIVTGCLSEPSPGWIDNFNGPTGLLTAAEQGILRAVFSDEDIKSDYVPADVVVKGTLVAAWVRGTEKLKETDDIAVYNACAGEELSVSLRELHAIGKHVAPVIALENTLRPGHIIFFRNKLIFKLYVLISHVLPAIAVDQVLRALGKKPMLLKVQRRSLMANIALEIFMVRSFRFVNDNFMSLHSLLKPQDRRQFFFSSEGVQSREHMVASGLTIRKDLFHQDERTIPKWRKIYKMEVIIDSIVTYSFYVFVFWWILNTFLRVEFIKE